MKNKDWISVDNDLPDNQNWMRVCLDGEPSVIPCSYDNGSWYEYGSYASYKPPVTHWKFFDDKKP